MLFNTTLSLEMDLPLMLSACRACLLCPYAGRAACPAERLFLAATVCLPLCPAFACLLHSLYRGACYFALARAAYCCASACLLHRLLLCSTCLHTCLPSGAPTRWRVSA